MADKTTKQGRRGKKTKNRPCDARRRAKIPGDKQTKVRRPRLHVNQIGDGRMWFPGHWPQGVDVGVGA